MCIMLNVKIKEIFFTRFIVNTQSFKEPASKLYIRLQSFNFESILFIPSVFLSVQFVLVKKYNGEKCKHWCSSKEHQNIWYP